jgi:hypothetical protein
MKNGLYSIHMHMLDGVKGRDSGILILRDGTFLAVDPISGRPAPTPAATALGKASSSPTSIRSFPIPLSARSPAVRKSPAGFRGHLPATRPKRSALA